MSNSGKFLGSQGRILDILEYILLKREFVYVEEISQLFKLSKSGSIRILNILVKKSFLFYSKEQKKYFLSDKFIDLSSKLLTSNPISLILDNILLNLKNKINDLIFFLEFNEDGIKVLRKISPLNESLYFEEGNFANKIKNLEKKNGSIIIDEYKTGYFMISIPVFDKKNNKNYLIIVILPKYKFTENYKSLIINELNKTKDKIEKNLNKFYKILT